MMDILLEILGQILWDIIVVPLVWILAAPFILIMSFFGKETYSKNIQKYYKRIKDYFWKRGNKKEESIEEV